MSSGKSGGDDLTLDRMKAISCLTNYLKHIQNIYRVTVPRARAKATIILIPKQGDIQDLKNPITTYTFSNLQIVTNTITNRKSATLD